MQTLLIEDSPARLIQNMTEDEFFEFCQRNKHFRIERSANGEVTIMPPAGFESGNRNAGLIGQLWMWTEGITSGRAVDSNTGFTLPNGSVRSPDAAWISNERLAALSAHDLERFPHVCPEFVIELLSPSDSLPDAKDKMAEWIDNGAVLGWLIDPKRRQVHIYEAGKEPVVLDAPQELRATGPVEGFTLKLTRLLKR